MKIFKILTLVLAIGWVYASSEAKAEIELYDYDKAHTQIIFGVNHLGYTTSRGKFMNFDGSLEFNRSEPEKSKVNMTIQTNSIEMGTEKWNDHMKNEDFFNVEKFPTMSFKSTGIEVTGENTANITGDLTILETTKPVVLDVVFNKSGKSPFGEEYKAGFSATTSLKRSDFGMTYGLPLVGDDVDIMLEVEAVRRGGDVVNP